MLRVADEWLTVFETCFLAIGTAVATGVATVQVGLRYLGGTGLFWAEELIVYTIVWTAFLAAGAAVRTGEHLCVELLQVAAGARFAPLLARIVGVVGALSSAALAFYGIEFVLSAYEYGQLSPALQLPMWIVYLAVPLSGVLLTIRFVQQVVRPNALGAAALEDTAWP